MVAEICVHDDHKVARGILEAVYVCGSQSEFPGAGAELDAVWVCGLELFSDFLRAVWRGVVDDDDFPVKIAADQMVSASMLFRSEGSEVRLYAYVLFGEGVVEQPYYDWQVAALVVGG